MGDPILQLVAAVMLVCWAITAYAIYKWSPGLRKHSVRCPEKKMRAIVLADQREAEFGCLQVVDVKACSLFPHEPLSCGKECLTHL